MKNVLIVAVAALGLAACGNNPTDRMLTGGAIGAASGAVVGSTVGQPVAGAVIGGVAGGAIGAATTPQRYVDRRPVHVHNTEYHYDNRGRRIYR